MVSTVSISIAEYEALTAELDEQRHQNGILTEAVNQLKETVNQLKETVAHKQEQLEWCMRQIFGQKSERFIDLPGDLPQLPGLDLPEQAAPESPPIEVPKHTRRGKARKGSCTLEFPDDIKREEVVIDVPEAERTLPDGTPLKRIGEDRREQLCYRPAEFMLRVTILPKYVHPGDATFGVLQEPAPSCIIEGSKFDPSFMAYLAVEKYGFHLPLYRIQERLGERGIKVTRQLLSQTLVTLGHRVSPITERMFQLLLASGVIHVDESTVKMQAPGKCRECRVWAYVANLANGPPGKDILYHYYRFTLSREHQHLTDSLKDFEGILHADAYGAYEALDRNPNVPIRWAACWAHARRKFEEAQSGSEELRLWVLRKMRDLFRYERVAWARDAAERLRIRQELEQPIVDALFQRLRDELQSPTFRPKSKMGKAVQYMLSRPDNFKLYLAHADVRMDNNPAERALRKLVIGRNNWMFIGSESAGDAMANLLSLVQTCRALGINPQVYLEDLFTRLLDHPASQLDDFLPDVWKAQRQAAGLPT